MVVQEGVGQGEGLMSLVVLGDGDGLVPEVPMTTKRVGRLGEEIAARHLEAEGYEIIARNWRCPAGEVDIVARDSDQTQAILVEVKTRHVRRAGAHVAPELAVGPKKRARYRTMALIYLSLHSEFYSVRFDVMGVALTDAGESDVRHLKGAYGWDENL